MQTEEYARMYALEDHYWWFQGRKAIVTGLLDQVAAFHRADARVLDLGCGTGLMLEHLSARHWAVGLDFSPLALGFSRRRGATRLVQGDVQRLPVAADSFDIVTALDLAEHVERDDIFFREVRRALRPGGRLVLTVPAHPFLWSDHDEALFHYRRYRRADLRTKLLAAGFRIERLSYGISVTFLPIVAFRFLQRLWQRPGHPKTHLIALPEWANTLLRRTVEFEAWVLRRWNLPCGVSLLAVAAKD
jgi:SAM-dependent methyltransferase